MRGGEMSNDFLTEMWKIKTRSTPQRLDKESAQTKIWHTCGWWAALAPTKWNKVGSALF